MTVAEHRDFIVTSQGVSATRWIAFALASHPKVFAAHGHFAIDSVVDGDFSRADDTASLSHGNDARAFYEKNDIDRIFAAYRSSRPGQDAYGNVHSYTLGTLQEPLKNSAEPGRFVIANVVRHPVSFIDGHSQLVRKAEAYPDLYQNYESIFSSQVLIQFPELFLIDCPDIHEFIAFAVSCHSASLVAASLGYKEYPHYTMESLTRDSVALQAFCEKLTGLKYPQERLDALIAAGAINRHRHWSATNDETEIYRGWTRWKQDVAAVMMSEDALKRFENVGYDLDALRDRAGESDAEPAACLADCLRAIDGNHPMLRALSNDDDVVRTGGPAQPMLIGTMLGYNIVKHGAEFLALHRGLGEVHAADGAATLVERHGDKDVIVGSSLEEVQARVREVEVRAPTNDAPSEGQVDAAPPIALANSEADTNRETGATPGPEHAVNIASGNHRFPRGIGEVLYALKAFFWR